MKVLASLILFLATINCFKCYNYYQPVLITALNDTNLAKNYTTYVTNTNNRPPVFSGYYSNYTKNRSDTYYMNNGTENGHLFLGIIQAFDKLLYNQEINKTKRWWSYREKIIEYPKDLPAGYYRPETITAIRVYNKFLDGRGAKAEIVKGGIGGQYIKLRLHSPFRMGLRYLVQIYGR